MRSLPPFAAILGAAGLIPFAGASLGALARDYPWSEICLLALVAYGAVILAFLGGVHWGFALLDGPAQTLGVRRARLGLGVVPSLIGWGALLIAFAGFPLGGVALLLAGYIATTVAEGRAARMGLVPPGYLLLRYILAAVVIVFLVSVLIGLLLGGRVRM